MPDDLKYKTYAQHIAERFDQKMQKLSVNVGFSCPNRDGRLGYGGCAYCDNRSFVPGYCSPSDSVTEQLQKGKDFFGRKYPDMCYLAYFQAYTSTYSSDGTRLLKNFEEALEVDKVDGLIISTRPDCIDESLLDDLKDLARKKGKRIMFEVGVETLHDSTLRVINRGHTVRQATEAIELLAGYGFDVCAHLIMGLPGETREMMMQSLESVCRLPITSLKLHQLQIIEGTGLHLLWKENPAIVELFTVDDYLRFCREAIKLIPGHIAIERFTSSAPSELLVAPRWGLKNYEFVNRLNNIIYPK